MATVAAGPSIEGALNDFLAEQRLRLSDATFGKYLAIVDLLCPASRKWQGFGLV